MPLAPSLVQIPVPSGQERWLYVLEKIPCLHLLVNSLLKRRDQDLEESFVNIPESSKED